MSTQRAIVATEASSDDAAMKKLYRCTQCYLMKAKPADLPPQAFGACAPGEILEKILRHGAWTRCLTCQSIAAQRANRVHQTDEASGATCAEEDGMRCTQCNNVRPPSYFSYETLHNRKRNRSNVCNCCKQLQFCKACTSWKAVTEFRPGTAECKLCQPLKCAGCGELRQPAQFTTTQRHNYFSHKRNVVCQRCTAAGFRARCRWGYILETLLP